MERMARAMFEFTAHKRNGYEPKTWDECIATTTRAADGIRGMARVALEAASNPTNAMCDAATMSTSVWLGTDKKGVDLRRLKHAIRWRAMVKAALQEDSDG